MLWTVKYFVTLNGITYQKLNIGKKSDNKELLTKVRFIRRSGCKNSRGVTGYRKSLFILDLKICILGISEEILGGGEIFSLASLGTKVRSNQDVLDA